MGETKQAMTLEEAVERRSYHPGSKRERILRNDYQRIGLLGEVGTARDLLGIPFDFERACSKREGDNGIDFYVVTRDGVTRALATRTSATQPGDLIYDCAEVKAELIVLCWYSQEVDIASPIKWTTKERLIARHPRLLRGVQWCFVMPQDEMWDIETLKSRIIRGWQH